MATPPRYFQKGAYYHVYNRGNRKQNIFLQPRDYFRFIERMREYKDKFSVTILSYCLMTNHFHFLLRQDADTPITSFMLHLSTSYAKYFNIKYKEVGALFQGPFKAKLIETDEYLLHLSRYIHRNPLSLPTPRVELGFELAKYPWSSYGAYLSGKKNDLIDTAYILSYFAKDDRAKDYKEFTEYDSVDQDLEQLQGYLFDED